MPTSTSLVMPFVYAALVLLFLLCWPIVVFLHELGHALMARAIGAVSVDMYVGSYGTQTGAWRCLLPGRITLWLNRKIFPFGGGLCSINYPEEASAGTTKRIAVLLAGPMASSLVAWALLWPAFHYDVHGAVKMGLVVFGGLALLDLLLNLLPLRHNSSITASGIAYSDGYQLYRLLARQWFNVKFEEEVSMDAAIDLFNAGEYAASAPLFHRLLEHFPNIHTYQLAFSAYYNSQQFAPALALDTKYPVLASSFDDHGITRAYLLCRTEQLDAAHELYTQLLEKLPADKHVILLCNRGYCSLLAGSCSDALQDFDAVLALEPSNTYALAHRGRIRLEQGDKTGLADLLSAKELNPEEPFVYCNLGLHAQSEGRYSEALELLEQAAELDPFLHRLPQYLTAVRAHLLKAEGAESPVISK